MAVFFVAKKICRKCRSADTSPRSGSFALLPKGSGLMKNVNRKFWLMAGALLCLAPAAFAGPSPCTTCKPVPEGGQSWSTCSALGSRASARCSSDFTR